MGVLDSVARLKQGVFKLVGLEGLNRLSAESNASQYPGLANQPKINIFQDFYNANKFTSFYDLSDEERDRWRNNLLANGHDVRGMSDEQQAVIHRNMQFTKTFGDDTFNAIPDEALPHLGEIYDDFLAQKVFDQYYSGDSDFGYLQNTLSAFGKRKMIEEGVLNDQELKNEANKRVGKEAESQRNLLESVKESQKNNPLFGGFAGMALNNPYNTNLLGKDEEFDPINGSRIVDKEETEKKKAINKDFLERDKKIQDIVKEDADYKIDSSQQDAAQMLETWNNAISNDMTVEQKDGTKTDYEIYLLDLFDKVFRGDDNNKNKDKDLGDVLENPDNITESPKDSLGNEVIPLSKFKVDTEKEERFNGTNWYNAFKDELDLDNRMSKEDKLQLLAQYLSVVQNYGMASGQPAAEAAMQNYIAKIAGNPVINVQKHYDRTLSTGVPAQIMNALMQIESYAVDLVYGKEGLYEWMNGRDASGDGTENSFMTDPKYWQQVEQFNTYSTDKIKLAEKYGGISPNNPVYSVKDQEGFLAKAGETMEMSKFVIAQYLMAQVVGGAGKKFNLPKGLTTWLEVGVNAAPIAFSYGYNAYNEVMDRGKAQLDKVIQNDAAEWAQQQKTPNEKGKSASGPLIVPTQAINDLMKTGLTREEAIESAKIQYDDYLMKEYYKQKGIKFDEDGNIVDYGEYNEDFDRLKADANTTFLTDNLSEFVRYAGITAALRKYMLTPGSRAYLRGSNDAEKLAAKVAEKGEQNISKAAARWYKARRVATPFFEGGLSNYLDEVTTGYTVGFGLGSYNNYLAKKYDPEGAVLGHYAVTSDFMSGISQAAFEGGQKWDDVQSRNAFIIGAMGGFVNPMFRVSKQARGQAYEYYELVNRRKGKANPEKLSTWQKIKSIVTVPGLMNYQNGVVDIAHAQEALENSEKYLGKNKDKLDGFIGFKLVHDDLSNKNKTLKQLKDSKERAEFALAEVLNNSQNSPVLSQSILVQNALQKLAERAEGNISEEDIAAFINENLEIRDGRTQEQQNQYARESIQKNAQNIQKMMETISKISNKIEKSKALAGISQLSKSQITYQLAMDEHWQERLSQMEEEISGNTNIYEERIRAAEYSTQEGKDRVVQAAKESLEASKKELEELKQKKADEERKARAKIARKDRKIAKEKAKALDLQIKTKEKSIQYQADEVEYLDNNGESGDLGYVLSSQQILNLNPIQRAKMLDERNSRNYSSEQRAQIDKARTELKQKNPDLLETIKDSSELSQRVERNKKALENIYDHPEEFNAYIDGIANRRGVNLQAIYESVRKADVKDEFMKLGDDVDKMKQFAKEGLKLQKLSPVDILNYVKENAEELGIPEENHPLHGIGEASATRSGLYLAVDLFSNINEQSRKAYKEAILRQTIDAESSAEVMTGLEELIDQQTSQEAKEDFEAIAKKAKEIGFIRDATKIKKRKQANAEKVLKDGSHWGWGGFHKGGRVHTDKGNGTITEFKRDENGKPYIMSIKYDNPWTDADGNTHDTEELNSSKQHDKSKVFAGEIKESKSADSGKQAVITPENLETIDLENGTIEVNPLDDIDGISSDDIEMTPDVEAEDTSGWTQSMTSDITDFDSIDYGDVEVQNADNDSQISSDDVQTTSEEEGQISSDDVEGNQQISSSDIVEAGDIEEGIQDSEQISSDDIEQQSQEDVIDSQDIEQEGMLNEEAIVTDDIEVNDDGMAVTPEFSERQMKEGENVDTVSSDEGEKKITQDNSAIENNNGMNPALLTGNYYVTYSRTSLSGSEGNVGGKQVIKTAKNKGDIFDQYKEFDKLIYEGAEGSIQDTIDNELDAILSTGVKIQYAMLPIGNKFASNTILQVIKLTDKVKKIHGGEHGTVECNGKKYLVVGTLGFNNNTPAQKANYNQTKSIMMNQRAEYFNRVSPTSKTSAYVSLTFMTDKASATPGYITRQLASDSGVEKRSVAELVGDGTRSKRNPHGIRLGNLKWGIQFGNEMKSNVSQEQRYDPNDVDGNLGAAYIYVPTLSGMYIPIRIDTCMYSNLRQGSALKEELDKLFHKLINVDYNVRKEAITELVQRFYFGENTNILIGTQDAPCLTVVRNGVKEDPIWLNRGFDRSAVFNQLVSLDPRVNITEAIFQNPSLIKMYSDAGAMQTDVAKLGTSGSLFSVYQCDANGVMQVPEDVNWSQNKSENSNSAFDRVNRKYSQSTRIEGTVYRRIDGVLYDENYNKVEDPTTKQHIECSLYLRENGLSPAFTDSNYKYYIISKDLKNPIVWAEGNDGKVWQASADMTNKLISERKDQILEEEKAENAKQELKRQKEENKDAQSQINQQEEDIVDIEDIDLGSSTTEEVSFMNLFGVSPTTEKAGTPQETSQSQKEKEEKIVQQGKKEEVQAKQTSNPNETGKIALADLGNSKKITNFAGVMNSSEYKSKLVNMAIEKGWIPQGSKISALGKTMEDKKQFFADKGISLEFNDVEDFFNQIKECY